MTDRDDVRKKRGYGGLDIDDDEPEDTERGPAPVRPPPTERTPHSQPVPTPVAQPPTWSPPSPAPRHAPEGPHGAGSLADLAAHAQPGSRPGSLAELAGGIGGAGLDDLARGVAPGRRPVSAESRGLAELASGAHAPFAPAPTHDPLLGLGGGAAPRPITPVPGRALPTPAPLVRGDELDTGAPSSWGDEEEASLELDTPPAPRPPVARPPEPQLPIASAAEQLSELAPAAQRGWEEQEELELAESAARPTAPPAEAVPLASSADLLAELSSAQAAASPSWQSAASEDGGLELATDAPIAREAPQGTMFGESSPPPAPATPLPGPSVLGDLEILPNRTLELPALRSGVFPAITDAEVARLAPPPPVEAGQELTATREFFQALDKLVRTLNLYEGRGEACARTMDATFGLLTALLARGKLVIKPTPFEFLVGEEVVYTCQEDRSGLSYRLFRDGMRALTLSPGLERWELAELCEIMRAGRQSDEEDSVTLLWDKDLPHLQYRAIDLFVEGIFDEGGILQQQAEELIAICEQPIHASEGRQDAERIRAEVFGRLDQARHQQAKSWRAEHLSALQRSAASDASDALRNAAANAPAQAKDLWRRAVAMLGRMIAAGAKAERVSALLAGILEELWQNERWEILVTASRALRSLTGEGADRRLAAAVSEALLHLCTRDRILTMLPLLERCGIGELAQLAELIAVLPTAANPHLVQVLVQLPPGEVQERLAVILGERRADLTDFHRKRLKSQNLAHVLAAIAALKLVPAAIPLLRSLLAHPHPKVRLEVLRALERELGENDVPALLACLALDHRELQELCVALLGKIPGRRYIAKLLEQVKSADFEEWPPHRRRRTLQLAVQWGGTEANDFIVKRIIAMNPLRRNKIEIARQDMIAAVQTAGGARAQKIFEACLASRPSEAVREAITAALAGLGG
jgi:hypothetical protein